MQSSVGFCQERRLCRSSIGIGLGGYVKEGKDSELVWIPMSMSLVADDENMPSRLECCLSCAEGQDLKG